MAINIVLRTCGKKVIDRNMNVDRSLLPLAPCDPNETEKKEKKSCKMKAGCLDQVMPYSP
jgi:hypothetical protein